MEADCIDVVEAAVLQSAVSLSLSLSLTEQAGGEIDSGSFSNEVAMNTLMSRTLRRRGKKKQATIWMSTSSRNAY